MNQSYEPYPPPLYQGNGGAPDSERLRSLRTLTHVLYALYAAYWLTGGLTVLVAIIINYLKRDDVAGTPYEAHFQWQIRTFWFAASRCFGCSLASRSCLWSGSGRFIGSSRAGCISTRTSRCNRARGFESRR
jgi:hypothetical protein